MKFEDLGHRVLQTRGNMGVRAAAREIGVSPTTLSKIERGHVPDMRTLTKVCDWIGEEPDKFSAVGGLQIAFKKKTAVPQATSKSLANVIVAISKKFADEIDAKGH